MRTVGMDIIFLGGSGSCSGSGIGSRLGDATVLLVVVADRRSAVVALAVFPAGLFLVLDPTSLPLDPATLLLDPTALPLDPAALPLDPAVLPLDPAVLRAVGLLDPVLRTLLAGEAGAV